MERYMSTTLNELNEQIRSLMDKRRDIFNEALDGRTQRWLSKKTNISEPRLSSCISGREEFTQDELKRINKILGTQLK